MRLGLNVESPHRPQQLSNRPVTRATKRPRLSNPSRQSLRINKRKHDENAPPSARKRRPSTTATAPPAKRIRQASKQSQEDIEMTDPLPTRRARRRTLKDVLRSHRINQLIIDIPITPSVPSTASKAVVIHEQGDTATQCSHTDQSPTPVYLTGDEQVDVIDISEASNIEDESETSNENPLQAHLLHDGRCVVRIVRPDGTVDYYTLHPHQ